MSSGVMGTLWDQWRSRGKREGRDVCVDWMEHVRVPAKKSGVPGVPGVWGMVVWVM